MQHNRTHSTRMETGRVIRKREGDGEFLLEVIEDRRGQCRCWRQSRQFQELNEVGECASSFTEEL